MAHVSEKTFRKRSWAFVNHIAGLDLISWSFRLHGRQGSDYKISVDGTDFRILEPTPFSPSWYSHKFKGAGLRYEVAVGIGNANIVWAHGPFPCRKYNDFRIYQLGLKKVLSQGEKVVADGGYQDPSCSFPLTTDGTILFSFVRARHEALSKRLKQFQVLGGRFRHRLDLHSPCFFAVLNLVQSSIDNGETVFNIYD